MNMHKQPENRAGAVAPTARFTALTGIPLVEPGDDLAAIILAALAASGETLADGDVLVIAQKIVSKAEGRAVALDTVTASAAAQELAATVNKDPRLVELMLRESTEVVRARRDLVIVAHKLGFVIANAGIDLSNVDQATGSGTALLLPEDPDASCARLRAALKAATGADVGVIISDSHGRAFRNGTVGVAIGVSGVGALSDLRGRPDLFRRPLLTTEVGTADEIAAAASLLMGQAGEGRPVVLARGLAQFSGDGAARDLVRRKELDLFRTPRADAFSAALGVLRGRRTVRRYRAEPVPDKLIQAMLEAATWAPSAHNRQPWRFAVLAGDAEKRALAHAMGERLRADRSRDGDPPDVIAGDVARSKARIEAAPLCIVVCLCLEDMDRYPDPRRTAAERLMAVQSTAMATENLLLAASAAGLGTCIMCAPLFCPDTVLEALDLPRHWEPQALLTLGYPASPPKPFSRRSPAEIARTVRLRS